MKKSSEIAKKNKKKYEMKYYNSSFATILRDFLQKKEFNQQRLAEKLDVSRQTISLYANGNSLPDIETLKKIIKYFKENKFDYSSDYWLGLTEEPSTDVEIKAINKKYGITEKTISKLKDVKYKSELNKLLESLNFDFIAYSLYVLNGLQKYYDVLEKILLNSHKENSVFIPQIELGSRESYYGFYTDIYDTITNIINDFNNNPNLNVGKKYKETIIVCLNRINESMDFLKYRISTDVHEELNNIYKNCAVI